MRRFTGNYTHSLDAKKRVSVPRKILDTLRKLDAGNEVVLTIGLDGCLFLYTEDGFESIGDEVDERPMGEEAVRDFARRFYNHAETCSIDRSGRLLIPAPLKDFANIGDKVVFCGVGRRVELWSPELWKDQDERSAGEYESQAKEVFR